MICAGCGHSFRDHATGRCVHSEMRFVASVGGTVTTACRCFEYLEEIPENDLPPLVVEEAEPVDEPEQAPEEPVTLEEPEEVPEAPVNIATRARTPKRGKARKS